MEKSPGRNSPGRPLNRKGAKSIERAGTRKNSLEEGNQKRNGRNRRNSEEESGRGNTKNGDFSIIHNSKNRKTEQNKSRGKLQRKPFSSSESEKEKEKKPKKGWYQHRGNN